jgi:hypothetical protein
MIFCGSTILIHRFFLKKYPVTIKNDGEVIVSY